MALNQQHPVEAVTVWPTGGLLPRVAVAGLQLGRGHRVDRAVAVRDALFDLDVRRRFGRAVLLLVRLQQV